MPQETVLKLHCSIKLTINLAFCDIKMQKLSLIFWHYKRTLKGAFYNLHSHEKNIMYQHTQKARSRSGGIFAHLLIAFNGSDML